MKSTSDFLTKTVGEGLDGELAGRVDASARLDLSAEDAALIQ